MFGRRRALVAIVLGVISSVAMTVSGLAADAPSPNGKTPAAKTAAVKSPPVKTAAVANLTWTQIVEKHVAARGGEQAWKAVQTLQLTGKMDAGHGNSYERSMQVVAPKKKLLASAAGAATSSAPEAQEQDGDKQVQLPFTLDSKRPNKTRLEIVFAGKTAVQVYDGANGWKVRPFLNRNDVEPFTQDEAKSQAALADFDGPLIDYEAKGTQVALEGVEAVEGQPAYKLKATLKSGAVQHIWIDAKTFLDVKIEGAPRRMDGKMHNVYVYQRDFRSVQGVLIPFVMETAVEGFPDTHKMVIEKAAVNAHLDDALFTKPQPHA